MDWLPSAPPFQHMDVFAMLGDVLTVEFGDLYRDLLHISFLETQFLRTFVFLVDMEWG